MNSISVAEKSAYPKGSYKDVVDYVQAVISHDPNDVFVHAGKPAPSRMPNSATRYIDSVVPEHLLRKVHVGDDETSGKISMTGVTLGALIDTRNFLHDCFDRRRSDLTPEAAARIIHAPSTLHVLAGLALQAGSMENENADMTPNYRRQFGINEDLTAIVPGRIFITEKTRGCPFAGKNGEIKPSPMFKELGAWSATLAVQSYFNHFHGIDPTDALRAEQ